MDFGWLFVKELILERTVTSTQNLGIDTSMNNLSTTNTEKRNEILPTGSLLVNDSDLLAKLDKSSIEDVVELKISRFLDQLGNYYPENVHELIMSKVERPLLSQILRRVGGNQVHASRILGINRNTLRKKMKIYGL